MSRARINDKPSGPGHIRWYDKEGSPVKAWCSITIDDVLSISNCRIVYGKNGLYLAFPEGATYEDKASGEQKKNRYIWITNKTESGRALLQDIQAEVDRICPPSREAQAPRGHARDGDIRSDMSEGENSSKEDAPF